MPVSSNFRAISAAISILVIGACAPATQKRVPANQNFDELINDIGKIEVNTAALEDLPGDTLAEKLLYQSGVVAQTQTAMLLVFDSQVRALQMAGNTQAANELIKSREQMIEAMNLEIGGMVSEAGLVYEGILEPEDIQRLIILNSDPAMQKLIRNQPAISQAMIPIGEQFGMRAAARYEQLAISKNEK